MLSESSVIRSIIKEMIISEADTTRDMGLSLEINPSDFFPTGEDSGNEFVQTVKAQATASSMVIARIKFTRADLDALTLKNQNSPKDSVDFMQDLRALPHYRQITRGAGGGIEILSSGEIEEVARREAGADTALGTRKLVDMLGDKISAVNILLLALMDLIKIKLENKLLNDAEKSASESGKVMTPADRNRIALEAQSNAASLTAAAASAKDRLTNINVHMMHYLISLDAHDGIVTAPSGATVDARQAGMTQEDIIQHIQSRWGGEAVGTYNIVSGAKASPFMDPSTRASVMRGTKVDTSGRARGDTPLLIATITQFNRLLSMQGLSTARGELGKGITGYDPETGRIDRNIRDPAMIAQVLEAKKLIDASDDAVDKRVGSGRELKPEEVRKKIEKMDKEAVSTIRRSVAAKEREGEVTITLTSGERVRSQVPGSPADLAKQKLLRMTPQQLAREEERARAESAAIAASMGLTAGSGMERREDEGVASVVKYLMTTLANAGSSISLVGGGAEAARVRTRSAINQGKYVDAAFLAFVQPIAAALTDQQFCDLSALASLRSFADMNAISRAANARRTASTLMSSSEQTSTVYEQLLQRSSAGRSEELLALFEIDIPGAEKSEGGGATKIVTPRTVATALAQIRNAKGAGPMERFNAAVSGRLEQLRDVITQAPDGQRDLIRQRLRLLKGNIHSVVDDVENDRVDRVMDASHYIEGSVLEPIRENDIGEVAEQAVSYEAGLDTPAAKAATKQYGYGSEEEREAAEAGMEDIGRRRAERAASASRVPEPEMPFEEPDAPGTSGIGPGTAASGPDFSDLDEGRLLEALRRALIQRASGSAKRAAST